MPRVAARAGHRRAIPDVELERRADVQQARAANVTPVAVDEPPTRDERLDRAGRRQVGVEQEAVHERRMATPQGGRELGGVARDATVAVTRALRCLHVDEDRPNRSGARRFGH